MDKTSLRQIAYSSKLTDGLYPQSTLLRILDESTGFNHLHQVTGILTFKNRFFSR